MKQISEKTCDISFGQHGDNIVGMLVPPNLLHSLGSCFSPQIHAILSAAGSLERDDVCNLRAAEAGLNESPGTAGISILNKASRPHGTFLIKKAAWNGTKPLCPGAAGPPTSRNPALLLLLS